MLSLLIALLLAAPAHARKPKGPTPQEQAYAAVDSTMASAIAQAQAQAGANPGDARYVYGWAGALQGAGQSGCFERGMQVDLDAFFTAADGVASDKALGGTVLGAAAEVALFAGRTDQALALSERALAAQPTNPALSTWLRTATDPATAPAHCKATLAAAGSDIGRFDTIAMCDAALGPSWSSAKDRAWYEGEVARRGASQAAHTAELQARWARQAAELEASAAARAPAPQAASSTPASTGPKIVSVSLKVTCPDKVRMFEGSSATSGGTYGWQSSNSIRSMQVREGNVICIADDRDKVQSCWTASGDRVNLEMGCGGFIQR